MFKLFFFSFLSFSPISKDYSPYLIFKYNDETVYNSKNHSHYPYISPIIKLKHYPLKNEDTLSIKYFRDTGVPDKSHIFLVNLTGDTLHHIVYDAIASKATYKFPGELLREFSKETIIKVVYRPRYYEHFELFHFTLCYLVN